MKALRETSTTRSTALLLASLSGVSFGYQLPGYQIEEIGTFAAPTNTSAGSGATGLNELGEVVGIAHDDSMSPHSFLYRNGQLIDLGAGNGGWGSYGKGVNDLSDAVGWWAQPAPSGGGTSRPFVASPTTTMYDPAPGVGFAGECWGINNHGQLAMTIGKAYCYDPVTGVKEIKFPDVPAGNWDARAWEVNNSGIVVGEARRADLFLHAYTYDIATETITDLHDAALYRTSFAYGINENSDVCGFAAAWTNEEHPMVWAANGQTIEMPIQDLSLDLVWGQAEHINSQGDVVGLDVSFLPVQPVGWISYGVTSGQPVVKHRLRDMLSPADRQAWTRMHPFEINDAGQICGTGVVDGRSRAFLMTPYTPDDPLPMTYCTTSVNTASYRGAQIFYEGTPSVTGADFTLTVDFAVPSQIGLFFYGPNQVQVPFGDGVLCVGAGARGFFRLAPVNADANGTAIQALDFSGAPVGSGPGRIDPGSTWNFQYWFRDPGAASTNGFNLSNALQVAFHG